MVVLCFIVIREVVVLSKVYWIATDSSVLNQKRDHVSIGLGIFIVA